jgi:hypothetical protein
MSDRSGLADDSRASVSSSDSGASRHPSKARPRVLPLSNGRSIADFLSGG